MKMLRWFMLILAAPCLAGAPVRSPAVVSPSTPKAKATPGAAKDRPAPRSADPQAEEVINAYLKAVGGRDALAAIEDRYEKFEVGRHNPTGKTVAIFERYLKNPGMVREDWDMDVKVGDEKLQVIQIYNGLTGEGWTKMMGYVAPLEGNMIYMLTWDKYLGDFFLTWKADGYSLKYRSGEGSVDDEPCHVVDVFTPTGTQEYRYFFSKKSGLLLKKQWRSDSQEGPVRSELFYSEYRKVNNQRNPDKPILFPFRREQLADGALSMEREFIEIRLNSGLSDDIFARPPGPIFKGRVNQGTKKDDDAKKTTKPKKKKKLPPWLQKRRIVPKGVKGKEVKGKEAPPKAAEIAPKKTAAKPAKEGDAKE